MVKGLVDVTLRFWSVLDEHVTFSNDTAGGGSKLCLLDTTTIFILSIDHHHKASSSVLFIRHHQFTITPRLVTTVEDIMGNQKGEKNGRI